MDDEAKVLGQLAMQIYAHMAANENRDVSDVVLKELVDVAVARAKVFVDEINKRGGDPKYQVLML